MDNLTKAVLVVLVLLVMLVWWNSSRKMSENDVGETLGAAQWQGSPDAVMRVRNLRAAQMNVEKQPPPSYDPIFFPAPAITEYITSVQFEHLQNREPHFDLDYQPINQFQLVRPSNHTLDAYKQATRDQIEFLKIQCHKLFDGIRERTRMTNMTFNMPFKAAHDRNVRFIRNWREPEVRSDLLVAYLHKLNDEIWVDFQAMFYKHGYNVDASGRSARVDIANSFIARNGHNGRLTETGFENVQNLTETAEIDGISDKPRNIGVFFDHIRPDDKARAARKYVERIYNDLLDHYKYQIRDVQPEKFRMRVGEIHTTGLEMLAHYLSINDAAPSKNDLDIFTDQVEESMRETLLEILKDNSVDITQFD